MSRTAWLVALVLISSTGCDLALGLGDFHRRTEEAGSSMNDGGNGGSAGGDPMGAGGGGSGQGGGPACTACFVADGDGLCQPMSRGETDAQCGSGEICDGSGRCAVFFGPTSQADVSVDRIETALGKMVIAGTFAGAVDFGNSKTLPTPADGDADYFVALYDADGNCERAHPVAVSAAEGDAVQGAGWMSSTGELVMAANMQAGTTIDPGGGAVTSSDADWFIATIDTLGSVDLLVVNAMGPQVLAGLSVRTDDFIIAGHFQGTQALPGCTALVAAGNDDMFVAAMYPWLNCASARTWGTQGGFERVKAMDIGPGGHIAIAGTLLGDLPLDDELIVSDGDGDGFVVELDDVLDVQWAVPLASTGQATPHDISFRDDGDVLVSGTYPAAVAAIAGCATLLDLPGDVGSEPDAFVLELDGASGCNEQSWVLPIEGPEAEATLRVTPLLGGATAIAAIVEGMFTVGTTLYGADGAFTLLEMQLDADFMAGAPLVHEVDTALSLDLAASDNGYALLSGSYQHNLTWADGTAVSSTTIAAFVAKTASF